MASHVSYHCLRCWRGVAWQEEVYDVVPQSPDVAHLDQQRRLLQRVKESVFSDLLRQYAPPPRSHTPPVPGGAELS